MTGKLKILGRQGHTTVTWCTDLLETVEAANQRFNELLGQGYTAFVMEDEKRGVQVRDFSAEADSILMVPRMVAG